MVKDSNKRTNKYLPKLSLFTEFFECLLPSSEKDNDNVDDY